MFKSWAMASSVILAGLLLTACGTSLAHPVGASAGSSPSTTQSRPMTSSAAPSSTPVAASSDAPPPVTYTPPRFGPGSLSPTAAGASFTAWVNGCYPAWEQADMTAAAKTPSPVTTVEIQGNDGEPRITAANLALWLGDPADTLVSADALLTGWTVRGDQATRGHRVLRIVAGPSGSHDLYIEEPTPTAAQLTALKPFGWPTPRASSPMTLEIPILPAVSGSALRPGIVALLHALAQNGSVPATLYVATVPSPAPDRYESYAGPDSVW